MKASGTQLFKNCSQTNFKMPRNFVPEVNKHLQKMKNKGSSCLGKKYKW
jgi:hypothetical protein